MELQVLISKKGTKVVTASNLHQVLQLANHHFLMNVKKWLDDIYQFHDGIRKPKKMADFAIRKIKDNPVLEDYYLSVEFAKLITLNTRSKVKQKYANWLSNLEQKHEDNNLLTKEQVLNILELTKTMSLVSCQESCEKQHFKTYEERNGGHAAYWQTHRSEVMGYPTLQAKKTNAKRSIRTKLFQSDKYEMIRSGVIDLFMAMGKSSKYASYVGDLAKHFAKELKLEIIDDRNTSISFPNDQVNPLLANQINNFDRNNLLPFLH